MHVDSYLEIFTTMYGWAFANIIVSVITGTGLVAVPFFAIVFKKWLDAKEQGLQSAGILSLIEAAQTRLIVAMFVASTCFFGAPFTSLKSIDLVYRPQPTLREPNPQDVSLNNGSGTTYDTGSNAPMAEAKNIDTSSAFKDVSGVANVPPWWYSIMAIASGVNNSIRDGIKSIYGQADMRELQMIAQNMGVSESWLADELNKFTVGCYSQARWKFQQNKQHFLNDPTWGPYLTNELNAKDIESKNSRLFMKEIYPNLQSVVSSDIIAYDASRDGAISKTKAYPMCLEWWEAIQDKIVSHNKANKEFNYHKKQEYQINNAAGTLTVMGDTPEQKAKDITTKIALFNFENFYGAKFEEDGEIKLLSALGVVEKKFESAVMYSILITGLPMIQALLLMGIYTFLPLAVFLSGYDLRALFIGTVVLFTVKMFASMWVIAQWIDSKLLNSMYPDGNSFFTKQAGDISNGYKEYVLGIMLVMLFIGLPTLWMSMMGWLGIHAAQGVGKLLEGQQNSATNAAQAANSTATRVGAMVLKRGMGSGGAKYKPSQTHYVSYGSR